MLFPFERFRLAIEVTSLMVLPPYKGAVFRGAFGNTFRRLVCAVPREDCATCLLRPRCLYVSVFEPPPPSNFPDAAKYSQAPPPYVINPPSTNRQAFRPGDYLEFELVLIGPTVEALPYFIYAFIEMGKRGLGSERGRFQLSAADLLRGEESIRVYDGGTRIVTACPPRARIGPQSEKDGISSITLHFLTPLRLKVKGDLATRLTFPLFFERLTQRLTLLTEFYSPATALPDFSSLKTHAESIEVSAHQLHWYEWERYSSKQKDTMKFGGLKGLVSFSGDLGPFVPWLRLGEKVNVGQSTTFGLGKYMIH